MVMISGQKVSQRNGQAILELAIFGSLIIVLFGILIHYGLRYKNQQQLNQITFRNALKTTEGSAAADYPISVTTVNIHDRHIPDPANAFAQGSIMPFSSSDVVTRNPALFLTPNTTAEAPHVKINFLEDKYQNPDSLFFPTSGVWESQYNEDSYKKLVEIYGQSNVWAIKESKRICTNATCGPGGVSQGGYEVRFEPASLVPISGPYYPKNCHWYYGICQCDDGKIVTFALGGGIGAPDQCPLPKGEYCSCEEDQEQEVAVRYKVNDPLQGWIIDYDSSVRYCRMLIDPWACSYECRRTSDQLPESLKRCDDVCNLELDPNKLPNLCKGAQMVSTSPSRYCFPRINALFGISQDDCMRGDKVYPKSLGLQQDYSQETTNTSSRKTSQAGANLTSQDKIRNSVAIKRKIAYHFPLEEEPVRHEDDLGVRTVEHKVDIDMETK